MEKLPTLLSALQRHNVEYALVGAAALGVHGLVRATEDIDLFVRPEPANVASLKAALRDVWNDPAIDEISAADLAGDYPTVRYGTPDEDMVVDIIARLGEAWRYEDLQWVASDWNGVTVRVATPETLYRMKKGTPRPQDKVDAFRLREKFSLPEN